MTIVPIRGRGPHAQALPQIPGSSQFTPDVINALNQVIEQVNGLSETVFRTTPANPFSLDAFGRSRVSNPATLFDSAQIYENSDLIFETSVTGSGSATYLPNESATDLTVTAGTTDSVIRQSRQYYPYQPGKSQEILMTFALENADNVAFVRRSSTTGSVVDKVIPRASWSIDPLDGSGPSGVNADLTKSAILFIDLEWLGAGRVRYGFVVDGVPIDCHEEYGAGILGTTYMKTGFLPVRWEITNDATNTTRLVGYGDDDNGVFVQSQTSVGAGTLKSICAAVISEGGFEDAFGVPFTVTNGNTTIGAGNGTRTPLISIRPKLTYNSQTVRTLVVPQGFGGRASTNPALIELVYGGTLTGASFASVDSRSTLEFDVSATAISGGIAVETAGYLDAGGSGSNAFGQAGVRSLAARIPVALDIAGAHPTTPLTDTLTVCATGVGGTSNCLGHVSWKEVR